MKTYQGAKAKAVQQQGRVRSREPVDWRGHRAFHTVIVL